MWAFGCRHRMERVAREGAEALRASLPPTAWVCACERLSFLLGMPPSLQCLDGVSAGQYFRLLQFVHWGGGRGDDSSDGVVRRVALKLLEPPEAGAALGVSSAVARRRVFENLSFADSGGCSSPANPSVDLHSPDIVCRCEDRMEFEAHQHALSVYSPVLKAQIAAMDTSQPSQNKESSQHARELAAALPALPLVGPSHAISTLLCICHQVHPDPHWGELPRSRLGCIELLAVATKYQIRPAIDLAAARWQALARIHPPIWQGMDGQHGMVKIQTAAAAPAALGWCSPLTTRLAEYSRVLEELPARTHHRLFVYLDACVRASVQVLERATETWELVAAERTRTTAGQPDAEAAAQMHLYPAVRNALARRREAVERCEVAPEADHARALRWALYCGVAGPPKLRDRFKED